MSHVPGVMIVRKGLKPPHGWQIEKNKWVSFRAVAEEDIKNWNDSRPEGRVDADLHDAENKKKIAGHLIRCCEIYLVLDTESKSLKDNEGERDKLNSELDEIYEALGKYNEEWGKDAEKSSEKKGPKKG